MHVIVSANGFLFCIFYCYFFSVYIVYFVLSCIYLFLFLHYVSCFYFLLLCFNKFFVFLFYVRLVWLSQQSLTANYFYAILFGFILHYYSFYLVLSIICYCCCIALRIPTFLFILFYILALRYAF